MRLPVLVLALGLTACEGSDTPDVVTVPVYDGAEDFIDDGAEDPGFSTFRDSLREVVARRDTSALLALVADDAQLSYDEAPGGPDGLRALWLSGEAREPIWTVLDRILSAGSVEEDGAFTVPFIAGLWPEDLDPAAHIAAVGDSTAALDRPGGVEVATLSGVLILPLAADTDDAFWHVRLPDGSDAYLPRTRGVSPLGYRATFWRTPDDDWKLHVFVSGD